MNGLSRRTSFRLPALALALLLLTAAAACSSDDDSSSSATSTTSATNTTASGGGGGTGPGTPAPKPLAQPATVTVVTSVPQEFTAALLVGIAMGEFEKENLTVVRQTAPPPEGLLLVAQNVAQLQWSGFPVGMFNMAAAEDSPVKGIANAHLSEPPLQGWYVQKEFVKPEAAGKSIVTYDDLDIAALEGATTSCGTSGQGWADGVCYPFWAWMQEHDIETSYFETPMTLPTIVDALTSMENGVLDVGLIITPLWLEMQKPDACCVLIEGTNGVAASQIIASTEWLENDPDQVEAFARALMRTHRTYMQGNYHNDVEIATILAAEYQRELSEYQATPPVEFDPNLGLKTDFITGFQQMFRDGGALNYAQDLTIDDLADTSAIENVLRNG